MAIQGFSQVAPDDGLKQLIDGNTRYVQDAPLHPNRGKEQREALVSTQTPFAVIVGCSDSRAAPEIIFDQGVGDLFVVRVAGNVIADIEMDSIEYAVHHLKASVVLVMGHENCGAIKAVIAGQTEDIEAVAELIQPAVDYTDKTKNQLYRATTQNAINMKNLILKSSVIKKYMKKGAVEVYASYYNIQSGKVDILEEGKGYKRR
ncbi:MAG: carbonic anhydrase [Parachlamydiales bacterium]|nr:carbonic anhydrase [Parachlamydiales bacterium]